MAKETAEEKLMKMMQKSGAIKAPAPAPVKKGVISLKGFSFTFSMRMLNQILLVAIVICVAGLAYEMRSGVALVNQEVQFSDDLKSPASIAQIAIPTGKDVKHYLDTVNSRNIFRPYEGEVKVSLGPKGLAAKLGKFKLVGVAWLDLPESASIMVEDTENKTTYFLKAGEQLEGVTVKTIYTDRVVFSYENEETIIKL